MQALSYFDIAVESNGAAREAERMAFRQLIEKLKKAQADGLKSQACVDALYYLQKTWTFLIEDVASVDNSHSDRFKAEIISIGLWTLKEIDLIRSGTSHNLNGLIDLSETIETGLL